MSRRFRFCLAAWIVVLLSTIVNSNCHAQVLELIPVDDLQPQDAESSAATALEPPTKQGQDKFIEMAPVKAAPLTLPAKKSDSEWVISIEPALKLSTVNDERGADYKRVYDSIPFNNAEFRINPSYRHDATMEILTGNARHQTIVRHGSPETVVQQAPAGAGNILYNPFLFRRLRAASRPSYYGYFPSLNPFLNLWNTPGIF